MIEEREQLVDFLEGMFLFRSLDEGQIKQLASRLTPVSLENGEVLFREGDPGDAFYIIYEGEVIIKRFFDSQEQEVDTLVSGDFFGEEALIFSRPRSASVTADGHTTLLRLGAIDFYNLLEEFPRVRDNLNRTIVSRRLAKTRRFDWLGDEEVVYQILRRHETDFLVSLIGPVMIALVALASIFFFASPLNPPLVWMIGAGVAGIVFAIALVWLLWNTVDWANDYYIVTNQRVVHLERVIWLYDSREEVPLSTVLSVNVTTNFLGRILGYGDVIVRTFTGRLVIPHVGQPHEFAAMIEEYWHRTRRRSERAEAQAMEQAIRKRLGIGNENEPVIQRDEIIPPPLPVGEPPRVQKPYWWDRYFGNFFKVRFEEGAVITYRKYWLVLLEKTWKPTLGILILSILSMTLIVEYFLGRFTFIHPLLVILFSFLLLILFLFPWWFYHYIDWRNDIYQVTDRHIFDIERRPLGTEIKKSAPLENILSLEHERLGFLGYLFNYGNVIINVGDARFVFLGVQDPARVQQEVFNRMYDLRRQKELAATAKERERMASILAMYHQNVEGFREEERLRDSDHNYGFDRGMNGSS